ncbi:hypothetical protein AGIG_G9752 [Arapaima gigas]
MTSSPPHQHAGPLGGCCGSCGNMGRADLHGSRIRVVVKLPEALRRPSRQRLLFPRDPEEPGSRGVDHGLAVTEMEAKIKVRQLAPGVRTSSPTSWCDLMWFP